MTYEEWAAGVPEAVRADGVWQLYAYRKALFLYDLMWRDCEQMLGDPRGRAAVEQLARGVGSIAANMEEGHGRGYGKDRDHFLRIAVGSARESKGWYYRSRNLLKSEVLDHRLTLLDEIIALLVTELTRQRQHRAATSPPR